MGNPIGNQRYLSTKRNRKIAEWAVVNPCSSLQEIGDYYGVTRERIRQILIREGVHKTNAATANKPEPKYCSECGKERSPGVKSDPCQECKGRMIEVICDGCGILFERSRHDMLVQQTPSRIAHGYKGKIYHNQKCFLDANSPQLAKFGIINLRRHHEKVRAMPLATHCKNGHEYTLENTYWHTSKQTGYRTRQCKICQNNRTQASYRKRHHKNPARASDICYQCSSTIGSVRATSDYCGCWSGSTKYNRHMWVIDGKRLRGLSGR